MICLEIIPAQNLEILSPNAGLLKINKYELLAKKYLLNLYNRKGFFYKYLWWGVTTKKTYASFADGKYGQFIFVDPQSDVVIVRNGTGMGKITHAQWYGLLMGLAKQIKTIN